MAIYRSWLKDGDLEATRGRKGESRGESRAVDVVPFARVFRESSHSVQQLPCALVCRVCFGFQGGGERAKRAWLQTECPQVRGTPGQHLAPHPSHLMRVNTTQGCIVCMKCGKTGVKALGALAKRCTGATANIQEAMLAAVGPQVHPDIV